MRQIGLYTVDDEPIGIGGMGKILRGHDGKGHVVAIKEIAPDFATDQVIRYHIEKEVKILWELDHPSIVKIYSSYFDSQSNNYYIIMEMVDGMNVEQYVKENGPMSEDEAITVMLQILNAMQHVHYNGIIHRDIKPSNIMIRENGDICLLDFGVAKDTNATSHTVWGTIIGTDGYMSPEQADGYAIDSRADIYALGCVLYFMLTGHHAFNTFQSEVLTKDEILNKEFPRLSKYKKGCSNKIQQVIDKATDKNMLQRYQTCNDFATALRNDTILTDPPRNDLKVTIGREKCDIIVSDSDQKISRHHADVELKQFTGGKYYLFTDSSANGTLINNKRIHHNAIKIPIDVDNPQIFLAGVTDGQLDWNVVTSMLKEKEQQMTKSDIKEISIDRPITIQRETTSNRKWVILGFIGGLILAIMLAFIAFMVMMMSMG